MSKEDFKMFVRNNPTLAKHVNNGTMNWQKFYDMYSLYGNKSSVWSEYLNNDAIRGEETDSNSVTEKTTVKDLIGMIKKIDMNNVRKGIDGIQKTISLIQDLGSGKKSDTYEPRQTYKHLDD